jgi:hypothetical protein
MVMELGIDKKKLEAFAALWEKWTSDPVQLRFVVVFLLTLVGIFGLNKPMSSRLAAARERFKDASKLAAEAEELVFFKGQVEVYEKRTGYPADVSDWQNYVFEALSTIDAQLISLEPRKTSAKGPFKIVEMELVAKGKDYNALLDFVDRLERGERLVRLERLKLEKVQNSISMTCSIRGLVKPSAYVAPRAEPDAPADAQEPSAGPLAPDLDAAGEGLITDQGAAEGAQTSPPEPGNPPESDELPPKTSDP